jgi:hypothetical protein
VHIFFFYRVFCLDTQQILPNHFQTNPKENRKQKIKKTKRHHSRKLNKKPSRMTKKTISSSSSPSASASSATATGGNNHQHTTPFPWKVHEMLDRADKEGFEHIVSWLPTEVHGFKVHNSKEFVSIVLPKFFRQTKYKSFQRQCNIWGFERLLDGPFKGGYTHDEFVKGNPSLCSKMKRQKIKGAAVATAVTSRSNDGGSSKSGGPAVGNTTTNTSCRGRSGPARTFTTATATPVSPTLSPIVPSSNNNSSSSNTIIGHHNSSRCVSVSSYSSGGEDIASDEEPLYFDPTSSASSSSCVMTTKVVSSESLLTDSFSMLDRNTGSSNTSSSSNVYPAAAAPTAASLDFLGSFQSHDRLVLSEGPPQTGDCLDFEGQSFFFLDDDMPDTTFLHNLYESIQNDDGDNSVVVVVTPQQQQQQPLRPPPQTLLQPHRHHQRRLSLDLFEASRKHDEHEFGDLMNTMLQLPDVISQPSQQSQTNFTTTTTAAATADFTLTSSSYFY